MDTQQTMSPRKCEQLPGGLSRLRAGLSEEGPRGVTQVSLLSAGHFSSVKLFNSRRELVGEMNTFHLLCVVLGFFRAQREELLLWLPRSPLAVLLYISEIPASRSWLGSEPPLQEQKYPALSCDRGGGGRWQSSRGRGINCLHKWAHASQTRKAVLNLLSFNFFWTLFHK